MALHKVLGILAVSALMAAPALAESLTLDVVNNSAADLTELYASPVGVDDWQANILTATVGAGTSGTVTISEAQGCDYDLRMVFADGDALEQTGNDLCAMASFTIQ
ncbi:hypothetical protein SAMN04488103_10816 [Gemmobacter aquatilis]|uniref:Uncharacterized protein n=1 Tax=Gemmobacter aquatilis TaxID=933059 RepID=A0A1H8JKA2_9RHOB|nr:hypothetical protein [Gemmobacter aquatilis]SEN80697.1 hypothetical protein SAMN04488103_10816 [Gemmobacter aquatilis]